MKTQALFDVLKQYQSLQLLFEYQPNAFVGANYHITEVKHVNIDAVDCGANTDQWNETIIQLWESPSEIGKRDFMTTYKALSILNKVGRMKAYDLDAEVKFEYSNAHFHTAQLFVDDYELKPGQLILKLASKKTDCKAKETCGVPETVSANADEEACCTPGSGCC